MRIRKRQVPLPLSSLIPVPQSDLYSNRSPAASVRHFGSGDWVSARPQLSDRPGGLIRRDVSNGCGLSDYGAYDDVEKLEKDEAALRKREEDDDEESADAVAGKNVELGPETCVPRFQNSPANEDVERLSQDEEKVVPLKKRRGICLEEDNNKGITMMNKEMKTKMNKKCNGDQENVIKEEKKSSEADQDHHHQDSGVSLLKGRKKARGGALMEGSQCSRVNGRGWRCCQQTLVGYSLCEHHLGKGRLRSMANVKSAHKNKEVIRHVDNKITNSSSLSVEEKGENDGCGAAPVVVKKRVKLGMVKARSISSLLGQTSTSHEIVAPADPYHFPGDDNE